MIKRVATAEKCVCKKRAHKFYSKLNEAREKFEKDETFRSLFRLYKECTPAQDSSTIIIIFAIAEYFSLLYSSM